MLKALKKLKYAARVFLSRSGEPETIDLNGRATVITQGGQGPPFVYLHSTLGESVRWLPFLQSWSKNHRVLAPMHPGFGQSGGFDQIDTIEDMAFHYVELFDALGLDEVILGGVSLGGWIAAEFAVRWPERVKRLWLCNAPGLWVEEEPLPDLFRIMNHREKLRQLLFHDPKGHMAQMVIVDEPDEQAMLFAYQAMTALARLVWERPYSPKLPARLRRIQCPTLLVWGESDRLVPVAHGRAYERLIPGATMHVIRKCGHLPMFEAEKEFVDTIQQFAQQG